MDRKRLHPVFAVLIPIADRWPISFARGGFFSPVSRSP
jgi:hypothetical protein